MSKNRLQCKFSYSHWFFLVLRVILALIPQTGYLSPKEFSVDQGLFAAKTFEFEATLKSIRTATSNDDGITSIVVAYLFYGWSYHILWILNMLGSGLFHVSLITPTSLLVAPRLAMCLLSFLIDISLFKICQLYGNSYQSKALILASSQCMLVFASRTLVNMQEAILYAVLLYFVAESKYYSNASIKKRDNILKRLASFTSKERNKARRKILKQRLQKYGHSYLNVIPVSAATVLGFFTRPNFLLVGLIPIGTWLFIGWECKGRSAPLNLIKRSIALTATIVPMTVIMILIDSVYYGYLTVDDVFSKDILSSPYIFTPKTHIQIEAFPKWNAIAFIGHIISMFHILGVCTYFGFMNFIKNCITNKFTASNKQSAHYFMSTCSLLSVTMITLTGKSEALDFVPLLMPFAYVRGNRIMRPKPIDKGLEDNMSDDLLPTSTTKVKQCRRICLFKLWVCLNLTLGLFYGYVNEGGVIPATMYLSKQHERNPVVDLHLVTSNVPPLPEILFMQRELEQEVFLQEYGSDPMKNVIEAIVRLRYSAYVAGNSYELYLLMPASKQEEFNSLKKDYRRLNIKLAKTFCPHFTFSALPDKEAVFDAIKSISDEILSYQFPNVTDLISSGLSAFQLNLYSIQP